MNKAAVINTSPLIIMSRDAGTVKHAVIPGKIKKPVLVKTGNGDAWFFDFYPESTVSNIQELC